jgi:hypothetical protein
MRSATSGIGTLRYFATLQRLVAIAVVGDIKFFQLHCVV